MSAGSKPARANSSPAPVVGSSSGGPSSQRSPASSDGAIVAPPGQRVPGRGDDDQPAAQERNRGDRRRALGRRVRDRARCRRGGARADRRPIAPGTGSIATSRPGSRAVKASISGPMCSATIAADGHLHEPSLTRRVLDRAPRLLGQAEDLAGQLGQPAAAAGERDARVPRGRTARRRAPCAAPRPPPIRPARSRPARRRRP